MVEVLCISVFCCEYLIKYLHTFWSIVCHKILKSDVQNKCVLVMIIVKCHAHAILTLKEFILSHKFQYVNFIHAELCLKHALNFYYRAVGHISNKIVIILCYSWNWIKIASLQMKMVIIHLPLRSCVDFNCVCVYVRVCMCVFLWWESCMMIKGIIKVD